MDRKTKEYQRMCRRAEAAGYPGDIADLFDDEPDDDYEIESGAAVYAAGAALLVIGLALLLLLPAVTR